MPTDPRKRQKKLERRSARRKEKKHLVARDQQVSVAAQMAAAADYPVLHCLVTDGLQESGIGWVLLARAFPDGRVAVATFVVDRYCLGVKDAHAEVLDRFSYDAKYTRKLLVNHPAHSVSPADGRKLVEAAIAYADNLGFAPHPDYLKAMPLFGSVNAADSNAEYEFGKDGKPFFFAGPYDTPERCKQILAILLDKCGPDGFHYVIPVDPSTVVKFLPEGLRDRKTRLIDVQRGVDIEMPGDSES